MTCVLLLREPIALEANGSHMRAAAFILYSRKCKGRDATTCDLEERHYMIVTVRSHELTRVSQEKLEARFLFLFSSIQYVRLYKIARDRQRI